MKYQTMENGIAIDINPLYNPYITKHGISPKKGAMYADRNLNNQYYIDKNDIVYNLFISHGWNWGGEWPDRKDYQHFYFVEKS